VSDGEGNVLLEDFRRYSAWLHRMTVDFVEAVPEQRWEFTPDPPGQLGRVPDPLRVGGDGFAPFSKQVRHLVCVRGVYNTALVTKRVEWSRKHDHYTGPLTREALLVALDTKQRELADALATVDVAAQIDWGGTEFSFPDFTWEYVQHEAIHHGQWSLYASLGGFETPLSWRRSWGL
jgi:hypothetical protein